jgi:formamidopyrimidine-DNA glycosylase
VPELPEVETIRAQLDPLLRGSVVIDGWAFPSAKFADAPLAVGARLGGVRRRGKYLLVDLDDGADARELVLHLGMTGRLSVRDAADAAEPGPHLRARWQLEDGRTFLFDDIRRFGRIAVVDAGDHAALPTLAALGPEPFDEAFTPERLRTMVNRSSRAVKTQLLSQRVVAGVGNIYADEALWRAQVHPGARRITRAQAERLRDAVVQVLTEAVANGGTTLRDYRNVRGTYGSNQHNLDCYGQAGLPCVRCGEPLHRVVVDARSTTYCRSCQRR